MKQTDKQKDKLIADLSEQLFDLKHRKRNTQEIKDEIDRLTLELNEMQKERHAQH